MIRPGCLLQSAAMASKLSLLVCAGTACFSVLAASLAVTRALGAQEELVSFYGMGGRSCGAWLEAREAEKAGRQHDVRHHQFEAWFDGFLSGYNWWAPQAPKGGIRRTDFAGAKAFLDKYCQANPTVAFVYAARAFIVDQGGKVN